ncbi:MAG: elongation factor P [Fibrobacteraceae bacterium]|jgi:elongation factor P|nr:elongation factor P [Fibrobacteraceae bacterium]MBQ5611752.1 elongation factor P [Fibrobacteraceae bacterium]MEE0875906.1 elongation factor P [Fibrobacteraceae bacterium]MEE1276391.1 elongation factor P [Fibrobacteraceae bacterium]
MGTVSTNEFRKKLKIMVDGQPYMIMENQFVKPGKGQAFNRVKIKNLVTGRTLERTWKSGDTVEEAEVTYSEMTYLYNDGATWFFMDNTTMETMEIPKDAMNGAELWLLDGAMVEVTWWDGKAIEVIPPTFVDLLIVDAPPGVAGNTASGNVMRPAKLETGAEVMIPLFIEQGTKIRVDTRDGSYLERAK